MGKKIPQTDRSHGGPGSSQQDATQDEHKVETSPQPGEATNSSQSKVGTGGGERDIHHSHDPAHRS